MIRLHVLLVLAASVSFYATTLQARDDPNSGCETHEDVQPHPPKPSLYYRRTGNELFIDLPFPSN